LQIHKPNLEVIRQQAARIEQEKQEAGEGRRDLVWFNPLPDHKAKDILQQIRSAPGKKLEAESLLYLLPPWSPEGLIFKDVYTHWDLFPKKDSARCPQLTNPKDNKPCAIHAAISEVHAKFPDVDLGRQMASGDHYMHVYVVSGNEAANKAQMMKVSGAIRNKVIMMLNDPNFSPPDDPITNPLNAVQFKLLKTCTIRDDGEVQVRYELTPYPNRRPIATNVDGTIYTAWIDAVIASMFDFDKIFKAPDDEKMGKLWQQAEAFKMHFFKGAVPSSMPQGFQAPPPPPSGPPPTPGTNTPFAPPPQGPPVGANPPPPPPPGPVPPPPPAPSAAPPAPPPMAPPGALAPPPSQGPPPPPPSTPTSTAGGLAPPTPSASLPVVGNAPSGAAAGGSPACFGGAAKRPDGGLGYNPAAACCNACPAEFSCQDACNALGISGQ
jgi:hypothetical protein